MLGDSLCSMAWPKLGGRLGLVDDDYVDAVLMISIVNRVTRFLKADLGRPEDANVQLYMEISKMVTFFSFSFRIYLFSFLLFFNFFFFLRTRTRAYVRRI